MMAPEPVAGEVGDDPPFKLPRVKPTERARASALDAALRAAYPDARCELNAASPHELLVATILSAQCTDVAVNKATPALFARFPAPIDYTKVTPQDIEPFVRSLGFFRNKAKAIHRSMSDIVDRFGGQVPQTMEELLSLHGVARKTANVVLGNAFAINVGVVVDTHVERLSVRLGLAPRGATVQAIERRLMALFPRQTWCDLSHRLIWHGRRACKARLRGGCSEHPICREFGQACELRIRGDRPRPAAARKPKRDAKAANAFKTVKSPQSNPPSRAK